MIDYGVISGCANPGFLVDSTISTINGGGVVVGDRVFAGFAVSNYGMIDLYQTYGEFNPDKGACGIVIASLCGCAGDGIPEGDEVSIITKGRVWAVILPDEDKPRAGDSVMISDGGIITSLPERLAQSPRGWVFTGDYERYSHDLSLAGVWIIG
nr:MAG TPA: Scaffolding protein SbcC like [Caudoviricetes sp.]